MGFNPIDVDNYFNGALDEVRIYNVGLTDQEVADLYAAQSVPPVHNENLVADYPFSGNAVDETAFNNNGWVNGAVLSTDRFDRKNHSFDFDGKTAGITANNSLQLNSPTTTLSFWVNVTELPAQGEAYLLSFGGWQQRYKVSLPGHGKPVFTTNGDFGCCSDMDSGDGNELQVGVWTHLAMVHDGAKDKIFVNGVLANEKDLVGNLNTTTHPLGIGFDPIDVANYFNGKLDDVQIYNYGMTDQEVADLYAAQAQAPVELDVEAPSAPLDLIGVVTNTDIDLSWLESTDNVGVMGYNVFQNSVAIMNTPDPLATITGLTPLTEYTFGVSAVDAAGNESRRSTIQLTTGVDATPDTIAPSIPANLVASTGSNSIVFSWDFSTDNTAVGGYVSFLDGIYLDSLNANQNSAFVGGLESSTLYTFEVYAYDLAGNESERAELTVSTGEPVVTAEEGLVAHYPFEGNADDVTPYANNGVIGGNPTFGAGALATTGMAIVFDGDRDSVLAPNAAQLISDFTTVSFWIRVDSVIITSPEAYILDFGNWDQRWKISLPQHLRIVWTTNSESITFPNGAIVDMDSQSGNEMLKGFWWYVTMVHDGVDNIIYVDGVEANRVPAPGKLNSTGRPLAMGSGSNFGEAYFPGALDEVKVYNKALTSEEITKLYETGTTGVSYLNPALAGYIKVLYPNPGTDQMILEHSFDGSQDVLIRIFDQMGRQVDAFRFNNDQVATGKMDLKVGTYAAGQYILNFVVGGHNMGSIPFVKL
jgi:chitodextrinase